MYFFMWKIAKLPIELDMSGFRSGLWNGSVIAVNAVRKVSFITRKSLPICCNSVKKMSILSDCNVVCNGKESIIFGLIAGCFKNFEKIGIRNKLYKIHFHFNLHYGPWPGWTKLMFFRSWVCYNFFYFVLKVVSTSMFSSLKSGFVPPDFQ